MTSWRRVAAAGVAAGLALAACATVSEPARAPSARFRGVRSLLLVRAADQRGAGAKDPLDGLEESLRARGFATRVVELGREPGTEHAALERVFREAELRASAARAERAATPVHQAGPRVAEAVAALGVDAVATYHRIERSPRPTLPPPAVRGPGLPGGPVPGAHPLGALVLVDRAGEVATFAWGGAGSLEEPGEPLNAAEAIELLVRALTAEPEE